MRTAIIPTIAVLAVAAAAPDAADLPYRGEGQIFVDPSDLEWTDIASMAAPTQIAVLEGNLGEEEPCTFRLMLPAGYEIRPHVHPADERVTVIEGESFERDAALRLPGGGFSTMAPGELMFGYTEIDTVIQLHGTGPWGITDIDDADDPRS